MVLWHVEQFATANVGPEVECVGLLVCCQVVKWHPEFPQSVGRWVELRVEYMWHEAQDGTLRKSVARACEFVGGTCKAGGSNLPSTPWPEAWHWAESA